MSSEYTSWGLRIFEGLDKDVEQLMDTFVKTGSVRYECFSQSWRDMNFSLVYCGIKTMEHRREFIEEAFRLAIRYISPPFDFQQRTGGLYLMYAFYSTQRHQPKLKIRLSRQQWGHLKEIETEFKSQGHLDAAYILLKLKAAKAFSFVHQSTRLYLERGYSEDCSVKMVAEIQRDIEQSFPEVLLRKLHETHHKYQLLKSQLGVSENLNHVTKSMAEVIANRFQESDDEEDENDNLRTEINRRDHLAKLKAKSFSFGVEPVEAPNRSSSTDETQGPSSSRKGKKSDADEDARILKMTVDPENRPLVDILMPVLQQYEISDSEDDEPAGTNTHQVKDKIEQQPSKVTENESSGENSTKGTKLRKRQIRQEQAEADKKNKKSSKAKNESSGEKSTKKTRVLKRKLGQAGVTTRTASKSSPTGRRKLAPKKMKR